MSAFKSSPEGGGEGRLEEALRRARLAEAAHFDALFEIRDAQALRLKALQEDLASVVASRRESRDFIDLALVAGDPPRLWLDLTGYIVMAPDPRTYRLTRDRQDGHEVVFETTDRQEMVRAATDYIAHRLIDRERLIAGPTPLARAAANRYSGGALLLAWLSGFSLGALALVLAAEILSKLR